MQQMLLHLRCQWIAGSWDNFCDSIFNSFIKPQTDKFDTLIFRFSYYSLFNLYSKPNAELKMHKASSIAVKPVVKHRKLLQWRRSPC
ncbi:hypothetical protein [Nostoc sp. DSM 114159]|jgi:hypothetical protein